MNRLKFCLGICAFIFLVLPSISISVYSQAGDANERPSSLLKVGSTFVWVPVLVKDKSGTALHHMPAEGLRLLDSGTTEKVSVINTDGLPISLVILMQTGGSASRFLWAYRSLSNLVGGSVHEITLVTFDSHVEQIWHFPARTDGVDYALTHQRPGDNGAAIKDAIAFGVRQLQDEPGRFRRMVLLLSQKGDSGSSITSPTLLEQLGTSSTVVYSLTFPNGKEVVPPQDVEKQKQSTCKGLEKASRALDDQTAEEAALLTGGVSFQFEDDREFNSAMLEILSEVRNGITLGFQPSRHEVGLHCIQVQTDSRKLRVTSRRAYWWARP